MADLGVQFIYSELPLSTETKKYKAHTVTHGGIFSQTKYKKKKLPLIPFKKPCSVCERFLSLASTHEYYVRS